MSEETTRARRLPPPAFPPATREAASGATGGAVGRAGAEEEGAAAQGGSGAPEEGAIPATDGALTLIEPGEPLPDPFDLGGEPLPDPFDLEEEGVASGIGDRDATGVRNRPLRSDPAFDDLVAAVGGLADALRRRGRAALHAAPEMSRFEATLRAYCVGYLAGRDAAGAPDTAG